MVAERYANGLATEKERFDAETAAWDAWDKLAAVTVAWDAWDNLTAVTAAWAVSWSDATFSRVAWATSTVALFLANDILAVARDAQCKILREMVPFALVQKYIDNLSILQESADEELK